MDDEKKLKTPKDYSHYSIRLTKEQKEIVDSTGKGLSAGIKEMIAFYDNWKDVDLNIRTDLKISCNEFCELIKAFIKANDSNEKGLAAHYKEIMRIHAFYIRRLYHHINDPDGSFLQKHCFDDKGFYGYLEFFWKKEIPSGPL